MAAPPRFMNSVYAQYHDEDTTKLVFLHAKGLSYPGYGDRHVMICWTNAPSPTPSSIAVSTLNSEVAKHSIDVLTGTEGDEDAQAPVIQIIQLTGQPGSYAFYHPVALSSRPQNLSIQETQNQIFPLGYLTRAERNQFVEIAKAVKYDRRSVVNGCRVWTRDLLLDAARLGLLDEGTVKAVIEGVPLPVRREEVE
ncbi:hypothetical protein Hypma_008395 [Hypsizygus marmoreus]|uniref:Uncharacterized protein n=1 Tax=Hypsizygus marmoreus TaxID=39966 RepID=A0A369JVH0_HYPMA|nr:hypothetical protein Hypma_008395 [Hypsizygus marmoreus]